MIYMLSGIFILIGYIIKTEIINFFCIFILGNVILILILYFWVFRIKIINFRDESQYLSEYDIYLHTKNLLSSITEKSNNRELMLNFLEYHTFQGNNVSKEINEENKNYNLYSIIEKTLKRRMVYHRKSILLKIIHFIILKKYLKNHKSAYLLLYHLYLDIENEIIEVSYSQKFFIFRLKKSIEDDSIEFNYNKNDISMRYQINSLIDLIIKVSEMYYSFWSLLLTSTKSREIKKINEIGGKIHKLIVEIEYKFNEIESIKQKNTKVFLLYGYYLRDILNNKEKADKYLRTDFTKIQEKLNYKNKNDYIPNSDFQFIIVSSQKDNLIIEIISKEFCINLGYLPGDLIGKNINILFPTLLKEGYEQLFKDKLNNLNYKGESTILYLKTKAKYLKVFPIDLSLNYDEEHNYYLFIKLNIDQYEIINKTTSLSDCHILTDLNCIINLFSSNSIHLLGLNNTIIGNTMDITMFIKELQEEIIQAAIGRILEYKTLNMIKRKILKEKYINHKIDIKWNLNNRSFEVECIEIYINKKLFGYYFHLLKILERHEKRMTMVRISDNFSSKLLPRIKKEFYLKTKTVQKQSSEIISLNDKNFKTPEKINVDDNYIPDAEKKIFFFPETRNFIFLDEEKNSIVKNPIENYVKKNILKSVFSRKSTKFTIKRTKKVNFSSDSSSESNSSSNSNFTEEEEEENSPSSGLDVSINDIYVNKQNEIYENLDENYDDYYKINFNKVLLYVYDFEKNCPVEIHNYENKSQVEITINEERNININKILSNKHMRKTKLKNSHIGVGNNTIIEDSPKILFMVKTQGNEEKEKKNEQQIENEEKTNYFNFYTIIWLFIILINFGIFAATASFFFTYSFNIRTKITQSIIIHNSISDLMENANRAIYFAFQSIILQNKLYIRHYPSKEELNQYSRDGLKTIYNDYIQIIKDISVYSVSASSENKNKIDNYNLSLMTLTEDLKTNITDSKVINVIEEFAFAIYSFMNLDDEDINFLDYNFNFILANYETLLLDDLGNFSNIFLDEFSHLKKQLIVIITFCSCIFFNVYIISFYSQWKLITKIFIEQERATDIFFKINPEYILTAIKNCENFIELNQKDKTNPEYLVSNPIINLSQEDMNESYTYSNDLETNSLLKQKNIQMEFKIRKNTTIKKKISKFCDIKKTDKFYMISFQVFIIIFFVIIIYIIFIQLSSYKYVFDLSDLYFLILNQRTYLIKYYNYFQTISFYYAYRNSLERINKIYNNLRNDLQTALEQNQIKFNEINRFLKKIYKKDQKIFDELLNKDVCNYIKNFQDIYNIKCDDFADGIAHYGMYSSSIYAFQLILYLEMDLENLLYNLDKKGYKYNEIIFRSDQINILYPEDKNLWEEYESMNPILILNSDNYKSLAFLIQQLIQLASSYLSDYLKNKMIKIVDDIKIRIIFSQASIYALLIIACYFFLIPRILRKNDEMKEEKNMLKIIPKNELEQILIREDIRI